MPVQNKIVDWFVRKVLLEKNEIIDQPGFIYNYMAGLHGKRYVREILLPESLFIEVENQLISNYGDNGARILYTIGKKFGYSYANVLDLPTVDTMSKVDFLAYIYFFVRYINTLYANDITYKLDLDRSRILFSLKDYIICNKNGKGQIYTSGGIGGIWSYVMGDYNVEAVQIACQGLGAKRCTVECAPLHELVEEGLNPYKITEKPIGIYDKRYINMNALRKTNFSTNSLLALINAKILKQNGGVLSDKTERYFITSTEIIYIMESEIKKLDKKGDILYSASYKIGKKISEGNKANSLKFVNDYLSAFGFGDVLVLKKVKGKYTVSIQYLPWSNLMEPNVDFCFIRGLVSGMIEGATSDKIKLSRSVVGLDNNLSVFLEED